MDGGELMKRLFLEEQARNRADVEKAMELKQKREALEKAKQRAEKDTKARVVCTSEDDRASKLRKHNKLVGAQERMAQQRAAEDERKKEEAKQAERERRAAYHRKKARQERYEDEEDAPAANRSSSCPVRAVLEDEDVVEQKTRREQAAQARQVAHARKVSPSLTQLDRLRVLTFCRWRKWRRSSKSGVWCVS